MRCLRVGRLGDRKALKPLREAFITDPVSSVGNRAGEALDRLIWKFGLTGDWWKDLE
jgi:hypothetical protein